MNCKPGDLAVIVSTLGNPIAEQFLGRIVRVIRITGHGTFGPFWEMEEPVEIFGVSFQKVADAALRPIRHPGDDAVDETLNCGQWTKTLNFGRGPREDVYQPEEAA